MIDPSSLQIDAVVKHFVLFRLAILKVPCCHPPCTGYRKDIQPCKSTSQYVKVQNYRMLLVPGLVQVWYGELSTNISALRDARDLGAHVNQSSLLV